MADEVDTFWNVQMATMEAALIFLDEVGGAAPINWRTDRNTVSGIATMYYQAQWLFTMEDYIESNQRMVEATIALQFYQNIDRSFGLPEHDFWGNLQAPLGRLHETQELVLDPDWWMANPTAEQMVTPPITVEEPFRDADLCGWGMSMTLLIAGA